MHGDIPAYGLWFLVIINSAVFIIFAFSFFKPKSKRDWRSFSAFSAFLVALFAEMYGFPLTIYLFSGWIQSAFPGLDPLSHDAGHIWYTLLGFEGDAHLNPIHIASNVIVIVGFLIISSAWKTLYQAQKEGRLATTGLYARVRHPQYDGFILIMAGFLVMWPTLLTLLMFPILLVMYTRLAKKEERETKARFGSGWDSYALSVPAFIPKLRTKEPERNST